MCFMSAEDVHNKCKGVASLKAPDAAALPRLVQLAGQLVASVAVADLPAFGPSIDVLLETALQGAEAEQLAALLITMSYKSRWRR